MSDQLELQREILAAVEAKDYERLEEIAVREGVNRDLWRYFITAMQQVDKSTGTERDA